MHPRTLSRVLREVVARRIRRVCSRNRWLFDADFGFLPLPSKTEKMGDQNPGARALSSDLSAVTQASSSSLVKLEPPTRDELDRQIEQVSSCSLPARPDVLLLYWTLVKDGVLLRGVEAEFAVLEVPSRGVRREPSCGQPGHTISPRRCGCTKETRNKGSERVDQFRLAALVRPAKFRACWQEKFYDGPTARRDAEDALRSKWLQELEALLKGTRTPMGKVLESKAGDKNLLGGGRRAIDTGGASQSCEEVPRVACGCS